MDYNVGDTIVYPHHGAAVIEKIAPRNFMGEEVDHLYIRLLHGDMNLIVPVTKASEVGVRDVVGKDELENVFNALRELDVEEVDNWSRRFKANQERLNTGDVIQATEVIRDLWRRDQEKGLSAGEKRILSKARAIIVGELALVQDVDDTRADEMVNKLTARVESIQQKRAQLREAGLLDADAPGTVHSADLDDLDSSEDD